MSTKLFFDEFGIVHIVMPNGTCSGPALDPSLVSREPIGKRGLKVGEPQSEPVKRIVDTKPKPKRGISAPKEGS